MSTSAPDIPDSPAADTEGENENEFTLEEEVVTFFQEDLAALPGLQFRPSQLKMAETVARTIEKDGRVAIEAGTGTGKSLAYLVPLLLRTPQDEGPAIIATKTVQLQEQLLKKDLPTIQRLLPSPKKVVLAKGWSNYLCIRKVESPDEPTVRAVGPALPRLRQMLVNQSGKVTRGEAPVSSSQWSRVKADPLDCQKRNCPHFSSCGLFAERRELETAELIVTNHAFLMSDLRLRREGRSLLPQGEVLVIDEAHRLDDVATEHLAVRFDSDRLYSCVSAPLLSGADGWLAATRFTFLMTLPEVDFMPWSARFDRVVLAGLKDLEMLSGDLFVELTGLGTTFANKRVPLKGLLHSPQGERLANFLAELCMACEEASDSIALLCREYEDTFEQGPPPELIRLAQSLGRMAQDLDFLGGCESQDWVFQAEAEPTALVARPVDNAEALEQELFSEYKAVIVTSASLRVDDSFHFFKRRTGLVEATEEASFDSPFEFQKQTFIGLVSQGLEPSAEGYVEQLAPSLVDLAASMGGRMLILTTSHRRVEEFAGRLAGPLAAEQVELLVQGQAPPTQLLRLFAQPGRRVLLGVDTFWEGVDIPGERLSCVVMTRLPFPVPNDVLFKARSEQIERDGGNSFEELSIPLVGLKLKQGFGRLLRTEQDKGVFLLTDPRACNRRYGRKLLRN
ncbi:MAG: DEAD/DEAH box helicase family protein, partial [Candidatus Eremiobacteraeota bacterium]|nr:DEAD/DEAH box helicase family protein [Candidatus Eremiobacteraeota bacterium]